MNDDGEDPVDGTIRELEDFRSKAHISWRPATDYTADHLVPFLQKEAQKSPAYRKAMKMMPWVIAAVCVVAYFGLRLCSAVDVSAPIASREGVVQSADRKRVGKGKSGSVRGDLVGGRHSKKKRMRQL